MGTRVVKITDPIIDEASLIDAAQLIRQGEVVAFPTETVYGLGANALDGNAVKGIFAAKGRPGDNPLIVHISSFSQVKNLVRDIPPKAVKLAEAFWPGPLTIILDKASIIPDEVTAGLNTVGIRMPSHPIAKALIEKSGVPIAAPSANRSGKPSPTTAQHVYDDMEGRIPLILDGGKADVGVESTVLDMTSDIPVILRPGGVTREMLIEVIGPVDVDPSILAPLKEGQQVRSPGMKYTHYSPKAPVTIYRGDLDKLKQVISDEAEKIVRSGHKPGILATNETIKGYSCGILLSMGSRSCPAELASNLFSCLREFDILGVDVILAEGVDEHHEGLAVMNRMARAAGFNIIEV